MIFFLTTQIHGFLAGIEATYTHPVFAISIKGGLLLPLGLTQAPYDSGDPTGQGYQLEFVGRYVLNRTLALYLSASITRHATDFNGLATHTDPVNGEDYDLAREVNRFIDSGVGVQLSF